MVKACSVLTSFSWVKGSYGCDLQKVKTRNQIETIKMLVKPPVISSLCIFSDFATPFILPFSLLSPKISIIAFNNYIES